jgi:hypothetical protein
MAKRIELTSSMMCLMVRLLDFDCNPEVLTLIQTPTGQQKRVETLAVIDRRPTLFLFSCRSRRTGFVIRATAG